MTVSPFALPSGAFELGPEACRLLLHTRREGLAARIGHDLTITFEDWSGALTVEASDPVQGSVRVEVQLASIAILDGTGGALPLTDLDRREIQKNALKLFDVVQHPTASFESTSVTSADGERGAIHGDLTIRGHAVPTEFAVERDEDQWRASATVKQTQFGITPYKAFLGALRLADDVRIVVEADLPSP